jgi:hypothetical protein
MTDYPQLPPGTWESPEAQRQWEVLLEWRETIATTYRQGVYLSMVDARMAARYAHPEYRARVERLHRQESAAVEAALREHFHRHYVLDGLTELDFDLLWLPADPMPAKTP